MMDRAHIAGHRWNQVCEGPAQHQHGEPHAVLHGPEGRRRRLRHAPEPLVADQPRRHPLHAAGLQHRRVRCRATPPATRRRRTTTSASSTASTRSTRARSRVEQFLRLNEQIGGYDINGQWQPSRMQADPGRRRDRPRLGPRARTAAGLGEVAVIAGVTSTSPKSTTTSATTSIRNRILEALRRPRQPRASGATRATRPTTPRAASTR